MKKNKIYFASPFFNSEQVEREERVKSELRKLKFNVWSPKEFMHCKSDCSDEERRMAFEGNTKNIVDSEILFAITDGKDMGTIWEAGFANGYNLDKDKKDKIKIIYYCETLGDNPFNLMLSESADIIITSQEMLKMLPTLIKSLDERSYKYVGKIE